MTFNINVANTAWDAIADAVRQVNPDLAAMVETSAIAETQLAQRLGNRFPFVYRSTGGGLTLFSRLPLSDTESKTFQNGTVLRATVQVQETPVRLIATHPLVPVKPDLFRRRNGLLAELGADLQAQDFRPLILLGDFNLTPWSPYYTRLIQQTKLHNTRLGFGIEPSWIEATSYIRHPRWITTLVKIPIDHILVSQQFKVSDCRTAAAANADHRMLWSDLSL
jgi:endonuclease/exonuclease/phosphatase (EEP) superfamily protein YafD